MYRHARPVLSATSRSASRRHASTTSSPIRRSIGTVTLLGGSVALVAYYYDSRSLIHEHVIMPTVRALTDPEESHRLAVRMLSMGAWARPKDKVVDDERLGATVSLSVLHREKPTLNRVWIDSSGAKISITLSE